MNSLLVILFSVLSVVRSQCTSSSSTKGLAQVEAMYLSSVTSMPSLSSLQALFSSPANPTVWSVKTHDRTLYDPQLNYYRDPAGGALYYAARVTSSFDGNVGASPATAYTYGVNAALAFLSSSGLASAIPAEADYRWAMLMGSSYVSGNIPDLLNDPVQLDGSCKGLEVLFLFNVTDATAQTAVKYDGFLVQTDPTPARGFVHTWDIAYTELSPSPNMSPDYGSFNLNVPGSCATLTPTFAKVVSSTHLLQLDQGALITASTNSCYANAITNAFISTLTASSVTVEEVDVSVQVVPTPFQGATDHSGVVKAQVSIAPTSASYASISSIESGVAAVTESAVSSAVIAANCNANVATFTALGGVGVRTTRTTIAKPTTAPPPFKIGGQAGALLSVGLGDESTFETLVLSPATSPPPLPKRGNYLRFKEGPILRTTKKVTLDPSVGFTVFAKFRVLKFAYGEYNAEGSFDSVLLQCGYKTGVGPLFEVRLQETYGFAEVPEYMTFGHFVVINEDFNGDGARSTHALRNSENLFQPVPEAAWVTLLLEFNGSTLIARLNGLPPTTINLSGSASLSSVYCFSGGAAFVPDTNPAPVYNGYIDKHSRHDLRALTLQTGIGANWSRLIDMPGFNVLDVPERSRYRKKLDLSGTFFTGTWASDFIESDFGLYFPASLYYGGSYSAIPVEAYDQYDVPYLYPTFFVTSSFDLNVRQTGVLSGLVLIAVQELYTSDFVALSAVPLIECKAETTNEALGLNEGAIKIYIHDRGSFSLTLRIELVAEGTVQVSKTLLFDLTTSEDHLGQISAFAFELDAAAETADFFWIPDGAGFKPFIMSSNNDAWTAGHTAWFGNSYRFTNCKGTTAGSLVNYRLLRLTLHDQPIAPLAAGITGSGAGSAPLLYEYLNEVTISGDYSSPPAPFMGEPGGGYGGYGEGGGGGYYP